MGFREETRLSAPLLVARLLAGVHFRARACILPESPKLETTRSLLIRHNLINNHPPLQAHFSSGRNSARKLGICCYEFVYNCCKINSMFLTTGHMLTNVVRVVEENVRKGNENCFELEVRVMEGSSYRG